MQIGERESPDADFAWLDIEETAIKRIEVFEARQLEALGVVAKANTVLRGHRLPCCVHLDADVLDQSVMPFLTPSSCSSRSR